MSDFWQYSIWCTTDIVHQIVFTTVSTNHKIADQLKIQSLFVIGFFIPSDSTGKSFSEALILVSTNPQYDKRLFIELRVQYMKIPSSEHVENMLCTQIVFCFCFDI